MGLQHLPSPTVLSLRHTGQPSFLSLREGNDLGRSRPGPGAALLLGFYFLVEVCSSVPSVLLSVGKAAVDTWTSRILPLPGTFLPWLGWLGSLLSTAWGRLGVCVRGRAGATCPGKLAG